MNDKAQKGLDVASDVEVRALLGFDPSEEEQVDDDASEERGEIAEYQISAYGTDFPVDGLVKRLQRGDIIIPRFQRAYVWPQGKASRFVESILLGLPVPGVFLARETSTNKLLVIDGQQRLKTLQYFCDGVFADSGKEFRLVDLESRFNDLTYKTLAESDRRRLDDYAIHATIIQQDAPNDENTSVYHIFERLNTGGMQLQPQEIRACIYHGPFNEFLEQLNKNPHWRSLYGNASKRMRDCELILRFFALYERLGKYERPMKEFLNKYMAYRQNADGNTLTGMRGLFETTVAEISTALGRSAFRPYTSLNAAMAESIMVGYAFASRKRKVAAEELRNATVRLVRNVDYMAAIQYRTTDESNIQKRIAIVEKTLLESADESASSKAGK